MAFVSDDLMTSDSTSTRCVRTPDGWTVSWIPGRYFDRNGAQTAMVIAETFARGVTPGHRAWPHVVNWLDEIGLTEADLPRGGQPW